MGLKSGKKQEDRWKERKPNGCNSIYASIGFIDSSPSHHFYLQNSQPSQDLIIFFLRKREREREREKKKKKESQNLFIREAVNAAHFFFKALKGH